MRVQKKPVIVEAHQWFRNGDHPKDNCRHIEDRGLSEGEVVRYYRTPECDGHIECEKCKRIMHDHGWIDTLEGGHIVCPADYIITGVEGEHYPCKPSTYKKTYNELDNTAGALK